MFDVNDNVSYKVLFNHSKLPFKLTGYLRDNFMVGDMETDNIIIDQSSLDDLQKRLNQWGLNSDIKVKNSSNDGSVILTKINKQINKLVS